MTTSTTVYKQEYKHKPYKTKHSFNEMDKYFVWWHWLCYLSRWSPSWWRNIWALLMQCLSVQSQTEHCQHLSSIHVLIRHCLWVLLTRQIHSPAVYTLHLLFSGSSQTRGHPLVSRHGGVSFLVHQHSGWLLPLTWCCQVLKVDKRVGNTNIQSVN